MATTQKRSDGSFSSGDYYTLREVAIRVGMTMRTLRSKYVQTGLLRVAVLARGAEVVPGYEFGRFIDELMDEPKDET